MPLIFTQGDLFTSGADILICPVNCVGAMGAGLALEFKRRFPRLDTAYQLAARDCSLHVGAPVLIELQEHKAAVLLFPTKHDWRKPSRLDYIASGLLGMRDLIDSQQVLYEYAVPALGCGLGGLRWADVRPLIVEILGDLPNTIEVYEP